MITSIRIYVSVVNLSMNNKIKLLEDLKERFERAIFWNKYRSETTTQPKQQKLDYMIDPSFRNICRLFVLSFKNVGNSFFKCYKLLVETKDFNASINNKPFFDQPIQDHLKYHQIIAKLN